MLPTSACTSVCQASAFFIFAVAQLLSTQRNSPPVAIYAPKINN